MTAAAGRAEERSGVGIAGVSLDAAALTQCRRRVHLDHDPSAADAPRALPDPALEQRRLDAAEHRRRIGARIAEAVGTGWHEVPSVGGIAKRIAATTAAVAAEAPFVWRGLLPEVPGTRRRGGADLLVRLPSGGYLPVIVVRHRVTDPGEGALTSSVTQPLPTAAAEDPQRRPRSRPRDLLRLAHLHRMLESLGWAPPQDDPHRHLGGVIGLDADVVVWHDLDAVHWPEDRTTFEEYDLRFADRIAVATAAAAGDPPLALPSRVTECRRCPWWPTCEAELRRTEDVSLVASGETATALRDIGITTVSELAELDPNKPPEQPVPGPPFSDLVALARAWRRGLAVVRRVPVVEVPRADVEVDIDMESFGESGAYLWGTLLTRPGGTLPGDEPEGYRAFVTWEPLPTEDEARSFAEFWTWLSRVRANAAATGRTFAAYCYNEHAENRWLLASARRFAGRPGVPTVAEVEEFIAAPWWIDLFGLVGEWFLCAHGKGLKRIAPVAGFAWRDPEAGGENSMRWYRDAVGMDGAPPDPSQRERLIIYNTDDVLATRALREWMTTRAVHTVPLASEL